MSTAVGASTLSLHDNRTGRDYSVPISEEGPVREHSIPAIDLRKVRVDDDDFGLLSYDPAYLNTASCRSTITYIDGDRGVLLYRGYPIEELAGRVSFTDVAYLLVNGELPSAEQSRAWSEAISRDSDLPDGIVKLVESFPRGAHPMAMLLAAIGALGAYHEDAKKVRDAETRRRHVTKILGAMSTLAGLIYRHHSGQPLETAPRTGSYERNFLAGLFGGEPDPALVRAIDVLFVLHADHEQNCSTSAVRAVGSSEVDPYSAVAAGVAALYGPLHGGANEAVLLQLREIGSTQHVPELIEGVKAGKRRLMGFGHRVYKNYDPRARIIKQTADDVFATTGTNPLLDVAVALEGVALGDDYFKTRKLYPNVDFYSGLIYEALGLPTGMFTVLFAVARTAGWLAQWIEMLEDDEQKITRPRQIYVGPALRHFGAQ